ncbi:MAG TPA: cysteine--tRNA ligase [Acidimicrobiales bacterium]|nr:cysteine--tRNA ligase [Acidimicrobiales bacterium]
MPEERRGAMSWREWTDAAALRTRWPTDVGAHVRALAAHAQPGRPPAVQIGADRVPVLGRARIYVCGITPYDTTHLGHAATFVWADLAARAFALSGAEVEVCRNVTDIDDHLLAEARARNVSWRALATEETYRFGHDMTELGVMHPTYEPRSFDFVDEVIALAEELVASGAAYERAGTVYFRGASVRQRAGIGRPEAIDLVRARGGHPDDPDMEDPLDAVMWQRSAEDEPAWPSPWGHGRPGWHAECSAMALATFGPSVDLHVGGEDLAFPHHAYEAAQAESYTGVAPFARSWLHVGSVTIGGAKMAKSAGNLVFVHDLLDQYGPGALRLLLLDRPWRLPWEFDEAMLDGAAGRLEGLVASSSKAASAPAVGPEIVAALVEDLDVPRALELAGDAGGKPLHDLLGFLGLL